MHMLENEIDNIFVSLSISLEFVIRHFPLFRDVHLVQDFYSSFQMLFLSSNMLLLFIPIERARNDA
jgi:hypothetical protein